MVPEVDPHATISHIGCLAKLQACGQPVLQGVQRVGDAVHVDPDSTRAGEAIV